MAQERRYPSTVPRQMTCSRTTMQPRRCYWRAHKIPSAWYAVFVPILLSPFDFYTCFLKVQQWSQTLATQAQSWSDQCRATKITDPALGINFFHWNQSDHDDSV